MVARRDLQRKGPFAEPWFEVVPFGHLYLPKVGVAICESNQS